MDENNSEVLKLNNIILFDGVCNLCNHAVIFIIDRDQKKKYRFASLQSSVGQLLLTQYQIPTYSIDSVILISNGKAYKKSTAALKIARQLDRLWPLTYMLIIIPTFIRDIFYNIIAKYRYKIFGKTESCRYPSEHLKFRFLDN
ncbi:thiol-disulfide oxidoreductase DCC family protein [Catalinimonas niigatensis]|uniref:thiol-disulfide oxidoreductase DCC family protein n=1 Tax=Catalinimonas niigatensis TaxID=1397264 RepID=UPI00266604F1|nr:DCC1-like thiol-disulfide oxidoreductase family protein [Catalinimonas niigatensis]WPP51147.1 DCC1-like thiol-disulfide oxidoreductase family protein [Catalinimonas niigatensis]